MSEKELNQFVRETLNESAALLASMMASQNLKHEPVEYPEHDEKYKYNKLDIIYVTAHMLDIDPELVKQVVDAGVFGAFKKKDPRLTPELVRSIKDKFEEVKKEHS